MCHRRHYRHCHTNQDRKPPTHAQIHGTPGTRPSLLRPRIRVPGQKDQTPGQQHPKVSSNNNNIPHTHRLHRRTRTPDKEADQTPSQRPKANSIPRTRRLRHLPTPPNRYTQHTQASKTRRFQGGSLRRLSLRGDQTSRTAGSAAGPPTRPTSRRRRKPTTTRCRRRTRLVPWAAARRARPCSARAPRGSGSIRRARCSRASSSLSSRAPRGPLTDRHTRRARLRRSILTDRRQEGCRRGGMATVPGPGDRGGLRRVLPLRGGGGRRRDSEVAVLAWRFGFVGSLRGCVCIYGGCGDLVPFIGDVGLVLGAMCSVNQDLNRLSCLCRIFEYLVYIFHCDGSTYVVVFSDIWCCNVTTFSVGLKIFLDFFRFLFVSTPRRTHGCVWLRLAYCHCCWCLFLVQMGWQGFVKIRVSS